HLLEVGPMVLALAVAAYLLPALALEVDRSRVEKHQVNFAEQIPPPGKECFFDPVLGATRGSQNRVIQLLAQRLTQKSHRPIQVMQLQPLGARQPIALTPALRGPVAARNEQA